jgi:dephospho-CoA kinase
MDNLPLIVGITGPIRSGKSTAALYLEKHYGYRSVPNVQVLQRILHALGLPQRRELLAATGDALFAELGRDIIARARVAEVMSPNTSNLRYVIDGIRYPEELVVYKKLPSFKLIALESPNQDRYHRALNTSNAIKDGSISLDKFIALNSAQSEKYVPELIELADYKISNSGDVRLLEENLDCALKLFSRS